jgi:S-DNA-T family DNA segregation ATPase FtsK/SpoIIIE
MQVKCAEKLRALPIYVYCSKEYAQKVVLQAWSLSDVPRRNVAQRRKSKKKASMQYSAGARAALLCLGMIGSLFLLCSCLSFDIADWPSTYVYPNHEPPANWCGSVGAFCAYYLTYYVGPGIFVVLLSALVFFISRLMKHEIDQLTFRMIGLGLLTVAVSSSFYCVCPYGIYEYPFSGGMLGIAATMFLRNNFAALGTFILIASVWVVGMMLLADNIVLFLPILAGKGLGRLLLVVHPAWALARERSEGLSEIWQRLSARQKAAALAREDEVEYEEVEVEYEYEYEEPQDELEDGEEHKEEEDEAAEDPAELGSDDAEAPEEDPFERIRQLAVNRAGKAPTKKTYVQPSYDDYTLPTLDLLEEPEYGYAAVQEKVVKAKAHTLEKFLGEFSIDAHVVAAETGPVITMFELELAAGIKVSQITGLSNDIARALGAGAVRVVAPLPGRHTIGIEVPNSQKEKVRIKNLMDLAGHKPAKKMHIPLYLGKDSSGEALVSDLAKMPHMLIAGTTGSGKSVCINSIIVSILMTKRPDEIKLILVDPKMVEMTAFNTVPHLMCPIVTETQMAVQILEWATVKMDERYAVLAEARVKNIAGFNKLGSEEIIDRFKPTTPEEEAKIPKKLPYIVIIIDELADLMMTAAKEIESYVVRLAQKSRAVGIHLVLATQRPQATVVTGLIKSNMPTRIGFRVAARMDSRIILDQNGAETLLGEGDMLFLKPGTSDLIRAQGTFLDDGEIRRIVKHLKEIAEPQFHPELVQLKTIDASEMCKDELFDEGVRVVLASKRGSVSLLQRRLSVGYARASRIIEMMAASGILGEYKGSQAREVMMTLDEYERICTQMDSDANAGYADLAEDESAIQVEEVAEPAYASEGQREYMAIESAASDDAE